MAALFAQMWALELAAFLLGAAVTWLVFVRPARAAAARAAQPVPLPPAWASGPSPDQPLQVSRPFSRACRSGERFSRSSWTCARAASS